jgi:PAS domain S-box-containing protein
MVRSSTTQGSAGDPNGSAAVLLRCVNSHGPATSGQRVVSLVELLDETCAGVLSTVDYSGSLIRLPSDDCAVTSDEATVIGLIVGEAVRNAIKYSHPTGVAGRIIVRCQQDDRGRITIDVTDDGVGLPENFDPKSDGGVGFRMMRALSERLEAGLTFESTSIGLGVSLEVPNKRNEVALLVSSNDRNDDGNLRACSNALARKEFTRDQHVGKAVDGPLELLEALPVAVYVTDAKGRITFFNDAAATLWGCRPELGKDEFCGSWKLYWPDGTPLSHDECPMAIALKQKEAVRGPEAVAERPDGTRIPFIPYPTPLFDSSGTMVGAVNMLVDISERKRAEVTLARHRDEQAALYQFTDSLFRASSLSGVFDAALDAIRRGLGCQRASILLFDESGLMKFVAWRGLSDEYRRAVEGHSPWTCDVKEPQAVCLSDIETADIAEDLKATVRAEGIVALAFIPLVVNGELVGKFMTYYDVPHVFMDAEINLSMTIARQLGFSVERLRTEEARQRGAQAGRLLASIIETSNDAIVTKNVNGIVTSWNNGAKRIFGYTADEMIGRPILTLIPTDHHSEELGILERIRRGERIDHYETVRQRKDGSLIDVSLTVSPLKDGAGKVVGASKIARDITERKLAQARHELLAREVQHRTKNLFAVVQAVVARSFAGKQTVKEAESAVVDRLRSLAQTHVMLIDKEWQGADLAEVVRTEMSPYADRVQVEGPDLFLTAKAAQNFALAFHELATNAAKYGALSNRTGRVHISWSTSKQNGCPLFAFRWQERGGPPVSPPAHKGFGSVVLEQVMAGYFDVPPHVDFAVDGVSYELNGSLEGLSEQLSSNS